MLNHLSIGLALRVLRESKQLDAKELSELAGEPSYLVSRIENGKLRLDFITAAKLTGVMGITLTELANKAVEIDQSPMLTVAKELKEAKEDLRQARRKLASQLAKS